MTTFFNNFNTSFIIDNLIFKFLREDSIIINTVINYCFYDLYMVSDYLGLILEILEFIIFILFLVMIFNIYTILVVIFSKDVKNTSRPKEPNLVKRDYVYKTSTFFEFSKKHNNTKK